jgi:hypothetical protein
MKKPPSQRPERQRPFEDLIISPLLVDFSDQELIDLMHEFRTARERNAKGCIIAVFFADYDDDRRELWEIPEVRAFCKRLVDLGFIADLDTSLMLMPPDEFRGLPGCPFGALEIWSVAENLIKNARGGRVEIEVVRLEEFRTKVLPHANKVADTVLSRPWPPQNPRNN